MGSAGGTVAIFKDANANRKVSDDNGGARIIHPFGANFRKGEVAAGAIEMPAVAVTR
jgi:hypothetical protein